MEVIFLLPMLSRNLSTRRVALFPFQVLSRLFQPRSCKAQAVLPLAYFYRLRKYEYPLCYLGIYQLVALHCFLFKFWAYYFSRVLAKLKQFYPLPTFTVYGNMNIPYVISEFINSSRCTVSFSSFGPTISAAFLQSATVLPLAYFYRLQKYEYPFPLKISVALELSYLWRYHLLPC